MGREMIGNAIHLSVVVGSTTTDMILDTGAEISSIPTALADSLIQSGEAHELQPMRMRMADGSSHMERIVSVHRMSIGSHVRTNVSVSVSDGMTLLGLPVLNAIGKFTIDSANNRLIFG
jgi:predicted aspartyl protease